MIHARWNFLCAMLFFLLSFCVMPAPSAGALVPVASFEGGTLYRTDNSPFLALRLHGDYYHMGRQYGKLLGPQIHAMYRELYLQSFYSSQWNKLRVFSAWTTSLYPRKYKELLAGMATTSGLSLDQLANLNELFTYLLHTTDPLDHQVEHCSCIMAWGAYTNGAGLVMGRNFDFAPFYKEFNPYLTVVAFNPSNGDTPTAILAYAGQVGAIQTFSKNGYVLENNDASSCGDLQRYWYTRTSFLATDVSMMLGSRSFRDLDDALKANRLTYPLIFCAADPHRGYCYESSTSTVKRRDGDPDGLLVATNHFVNPRWGPLPAPTTDSVMRYRNLVALGRGHRGSINPAVMSAILDTPFEHGGATTELTIYQFVAYPSRLTLWLKAPGFADWTEFRLSQLFLAH